MRKEEIKVIFVAIVVYGMLVSEYRICGVC